MNRIPLPATTRSILIVDDNPEMCEALAIVLRDAGYHVRVHHDAETAFDSLRGYLPNLVILDVRLGPSGMSGTEFLAAMKRIPIYADVPVIVTSGMQPSGVGWVVFAEKPIEQETLLDAVKRYAR